MKLTFLRDIYLFGMAIIHNLLYWIAARTHLNNNLWIFGSWFGNTYNDNSKYLFEYVNKNFPDITAVWLSRKKDIIQKLQKRGFRAYHFYSPLGVWYTLRAGIAIFSVGYTSDLPGFCISPSKKLIQLWHGAFLKKFGILNTKPQDTNQRIFPYIKNSTLTRWILRLYNKLFEADIRHFSYMDYKLEQYRKYTYITAISPIIKKEYIESFGIPKNQADKIIITGFPRNDALFNDATGYSNQIARTIKDIHQSGGSVGFYLPTHRREGEEEILKAIISNLKPYQDMMEAKKIYILIKLHQFHQKEITVEKLKNIIIVADKDIDDDVYPLLSMTDFLITDYSGIYFDYLLVNKPIIYLIYDFDRYIKVDREFYFPFEEVTPGPKISLWKQLIPTIHREIRKDTFKKKRQKMIKLFHTYKDGNSSRRVAEKIYKECVTQTLMSSRRSRNNRKIIRKCYLELLKREPDEFGWNYYLDLMDRSKINENKLIKIIKDSNEYKKIKLAEIYDLKLGYIFKGLYDIKYNIRPNSVLDNIVVKEGILDKWMCLRLNKFIHKDATIFDIGANAGLLSLPFAKIYVPLGRVYSFEPVNSIVRQLKMNIKVNKFSNIIVEQLALQDNPKIDKITLNNRVAIHDNGLRNDGLSTIEKNPIYKISETIVNTSTIDKYASKETIFKLEFIKIDTEGSEYRILKGGEKTIKKFHPIIVYEYSPGIDKLINFENSKNAFMFIKKMGYKQYRIFKKRILIDMKNYNANFADCNIICFHESNLPMQKLILDLYRN